MPDDTPRVPAHSDPGRPRVGRDQRSRRVRALAWAARFPVNMRFVGGRRMAPPLSRVVQERIAYADIELDVARGKA